MPKSRHSPHHRKRRPELAILPAPKAARAAKPGLVTWPARRRRPDPPMPPLLARMTAPSRGEGGP